MKVSKLLLMALIVQFLLTGNSIAQVKKSPAKVPAPVQTKYGALAVDRSNGFMAFRSINQIEPKLKRELWPNATNAEAHAQLY